jgi:hypothetical protein
MLKFHLREDLLEGNILVAEMNPTTSEVTMETASENDVIKYLKGIYGSDDRYISRFHNKMMKAKREEVRTYMTSLLEKYKVSEPFTYKEAFEIEDDRFKAMVFSSINIEDMLNNLGKTRIKADGIPVKRKQFDREGNLTGYKEYDNIYETYAVDGTELGIREPLYVVKCWCTSTNNEHWLWIESQYKDDPLTAIASTFRIHENLIPHITELKRQGDIILVELDEDITPLGNIIPLTKEQYFDLLTCET